MDLPVPDSLARLIFSYVIKCDYELNDSVTSLRIDQCQDIKLIERFIDIVGSLISLDVAYHIMINCYYTENLVVAKYLREKYDIRSHKPELFLPKVEFEMNLCSKCSPISLQQFINEFNVTIEIQIGFNPFRVACVSGNLSAAKWIKSYLNLTREQCLGSNNFGHVCADGHMMMAKWLKDELKITKDEALVIFKYDIEFKLLKRKDVLDWLHQEFGIVESDYSGIVGKNRKFSNRIYGIASLLGRVCDYDGDSLSIYPGGSIVT
jgi:hypothetical protein